MSKRQDTGWDYITEDIEANPQVVSGPTPEGPKPCQLIDQHVADDGTIFGEDEFHDPCYRTPGSTEDVSAPTGMRLLSGGREWIVTEYDPDCPLSSPPLNRPASEVRTARYWAMIQDLLLD